MISSKLLAGDVILTAASGSPGIHGTGMLMPWIHRGIRFEGSREVLWNEREHPIAKEIRLHENAPPKTFIRMNRT